MFEPPRNNDHNAAFPDVEIAMEKEGVLKVGDIAVREFNFAADTDIPLAQVSLTFSKNGFVGATRQYVQDTMKVAREMITERSPNLNDSEKKLQELDFPGVDRLLEHPSALHNFVTQYPFEGLFYLERLLPPNEDTFRFVINSIERVEVSGDEVTLHCLCYDRVYPDSGICGSS